MTSRVGKKFATTRTIVNPMRTTTQGLKASRNQIRGETSADSWLSEALPNGGILTCVRAADTRSTRRSTTPGGVTDSQAVCSRISRTRSSAGTKCEAVGPRLRHQMWASFIFLAFHSAILTDIRVSECNLGWQVKLFAVRRSYEIRNQQVKAKRI